MSRDTILQCLEIATRSTTMEGEAHAALHQARRLMQKAGMGIRDLTSGDEDADEIDLLEDQVSRLEAENAQLRHDLTKTKDRLLKKPAKRKVATGFCTFAEFKAAAIVHTGRSHGWLAAVSDASRDSDLIRFVHPSELQRWRAEGQVPMALYNALPSLRYAARVTRGMWSAALYRFIHENRRGTPQAVSDAVFEAFRVRISTTSIKGALNRIRAGAKRHGNAEAWFLTME